MKIDFAQSLPAADDKTLFVEFSSKDKRQEIVREADGRRTLVIPIGKKDELNPRKFMTSIRKATLAAKAADAKRMVVSWEEPFFSDAVAPAAVLASMLAENVVIGNYEFTTYKTPGKDGFKSIEELVIVGADKGLEQAAKRGRTIGEQVNECREMANTPANVMDPEGFADATKKAVKGTDVKVSVLDEKEMKKLGMNLVLAIGQSSPKPPRFVIAEYWGGKKGEVPIVFVGKGVTFDSGGIDIKTNSGAYEMHLDKSGGAAVVHATILAAKLGVKRNIVALVPLVENMPSGSSPKPGDIVRSMSGVMVEIINTDAEGRVILGDALAYAQKYKPQLIVDVATLTGAALIAFGQYSSALMVSDKKLLDRFEGFGEASGDYVDRLPCRPEYEEMIKPKRADIANLTVNGNSRYGGTIAAGMFLKKFVGEYPWAHIDMAPRMEPAPGEPLAPGATGEPVRLLLKIAEEFSIQK